MNHRPFYQFTPQDDRVWAALWQRQHPEVLKYAHPLYLDGLQKLDLSPQRIPDFAALNDQFKREVGWELVSTDVQYSDGQDWFEALARKEFLITEYIRPLDSLDYTPLPDIWHDAFGHLPWMIQPEYAEYVHDFALKAVQFAPEKRRAFGSLWWYSIEFGLMRHEDRVTAFGAGLMSGYAEMIRAMDGTVPHHDFNLSRMDHTDPSPHEFHEEFFVFDSFDHLRTMTAAWYEQHQNQRIGA